jgi:hypothetical protein
MNLRIDPEFQRLIPPLTSYEYKQLENNLLRDGCREPISVWNNIILDGHNRYAICTRHKISYSIAIINLSCREAAIAWICSTQIGRRNITEETRRYLIGKRYEAEKRIGPPNIHGANQNTIPVAHKIYAQPQSKIRRHKTALAISKDYRISIGTVQKYARYAVSLDSIAERENILVSKLLNGQVKVSQDNLIQLAKMSDNELHKICGKLSDTPEETLPYNEGRKILSGYAKDTAGRSTSVKDMPAYDPDAEISSLALTIPSWRGSIERVMANTDMVSTSEKAKQRLLGELMRLGQAIEQMLKVIREDR